MKNIKYIKISLRAMIVIIVVILIIIFSLMYLFLNERKKNIYSKNFVNTVDNNSSVSETKKNSLTSEQAKEIIIKYLNLHILNDQGSALLCSYDALEEYGLQLYKTYDEMYSNISKSDIIKYDGENEIELYKTNIKYTDYKYALLKYVSEDIFENEFTLYSSNIDGILYIMNKPEQNVKFNIKNIKQISNENEVYKYKVYADLYENDVETNNYSISITIKQNEDTKFVVFESSFDTLNSVNEAEEQNADSNKIVVSSMFEDSTAKNLFQKFLELKSLSNQGASILQSDGLNLYGDEVEDIYTKLEQSDKKIKRNELDVNLYKTDIEYSKYKSSLLNYVSEDVFNSEFTNYCENVDGLLYIIYMPVNEYDYVITSTKKISEDEYIYEFNTEVKLNSNTQVNLKNEKKYVVTFEKNKDGIYVISNIK